MRRSGVQIPSAPPDPGSLDLPDQMTGRPPPGPMDATENPAEPISRNTQFLKFWFARIFATSSLQMLAVCVGWQIYDLTNSALDLGLVGLFQFIPAVMFVLIAGHVADHYHRGRVIQIAQAVAALVAGVLAIGTASGFLTPRNDLRACFRSRCFARFRIADLARDASRPRAGVDLAARDRGVCLRQSDSDHRRSRHSAGCSTRSIRRLPI